LSKENAQALAFPAPLVQPDLHNLFIHTLSHGTTSWVEAIKEHSDLTHFIRYDARTAKVLEDGGVAAAQEETFIGWMLELHQGMFLGLGGDLFMGFMGLLFLLALISGVGVYGRS
jgi:uncharacterized iron-regulated membrane protein